MVNVFRRSARIGVVTTTYPDVPEPTPPAFRGQIQLRTDRCIGDGACARVCPSEAIAVIGMPDEGWAWKLDDARCVFCGLCADACPTGAVLVSNEFELAVRNQNDLMTLATFDAHSSTSPNEEESS